MEAGSSANNGLEARNSGKILEGSIIITTNLTFDRWGDVFGDPTLTGAMMDRLAHKALILDISREKGARLAETLEWLAKANPSTFCCFFAVNLLLSTHCDMRGLSRARSVHLDP
jgi:hypothetical protein